MHINKKAHGTKSRNDFLHRALFNFSPLSILRSFPRFSPFYIVNNPGHFLPAFISSLK